MSTKLLETVEIDSENARGSVIWLHGLGADGHDFEALVPELKLPAEHGLRFIFPHAPFRTITMNNSQPLRGWFDVKTLDRDAWDDREGILESAQSVNALIDREKERGIASEKILLAGFSQGGTMALYCGLRYPEKLAGIMGLSTYMPLTEDFAKEATAMNRETSIFMAHGSMDDIVLPTLGDETYEFLRGLGYDVAWHEYPMMHQVCRQEVEEIRSWLMNCFNLSS